MLILFRCKAFESVHLFCPHISFIENAAVKTAAFSRLTTEIPQTDFCFRGITVNLFRHQLLHLVGYVGICVQGSSAGYITQNCRQGLDVHSVGLGVGCKSMARTMKSHPFTSRIIQNSVQALMGRGWTHGQVFFLWGWKHPS